MLIRLNIYGRYMAAPGLKQKTPKAANDQNQTEKPDELLARIDKFKSNELVIGLAFPLGTTTAHLKNSIEDYFKVNDYQVKTYKISRLIVEVMNELISEQKRNEFLKRLEIPRGGPLYEEGNEYFRVNNLQLAGNFIRDEFEPGVLAQLAIRKIALDRMEKAKGLYEKKLDNSELPKGMELSEFSTSSYYLPEKTVYIVDSLKNPAEAEILKAVYGDIFYLIGAIQSREERIDNLANRIKIARKSKGQIQGYAKELEERDRKQSDDHEQQLDKTLNNCDFFISIRKSEKQSSVDAEIKRFFNLVHGIGVNTPTSDEYGMYIAYSAGLGSACLSRQVGASIADSDGNIVSTGCNDVPKFNGGLYIATDSPDERCYVNEGFCRNDDQKNQMKANVADILEKAGVENSGDVAKRIFKEARIKDLIEFSRAVHAEMEAIVSLSRRGDGVTKGATLYTTTFPCHNCARHIVAAGITRVVFIEPYDKSLALELHKDSITRDKERDKLPFDHFTGISPIKYPIIFKSTSVRKDEEGRFTGMSKDPSSRSLTYLEAYRDLEQRTNEHLNQSGLRLNH